MTRPLDRPNALPGNTYKVSWPEHDHAFYITVNDIVQDGRRRPFEVFINSKNMEHYAWTVALTRMISAVFRRGGDVSFVVDELKAVFDPRGGQWMGGRYVPSLLAAIGDVAHPTWRARSVGVYRLWRDGGFAVGAMLAGVLADLVSIEAAIHTVAALTALSGIVVIVRMHETHHVGPTSNAVAPPR